MLSMSLQTANSTNGASRAAAPAAASTGTDFASLLPTATPAADDISASPAEPDALPVRANIIDIAGVAAAATRAAEQAGASDMVAQGAATTVPQPDVATTEQVVAATATAMPAPGGSPIDAAEAGKADTARDTPDASDAGDKPDDAAKAGAIAPSTATATPDAAPAAPTAIIAPVIAASAQVAGTPQTAAATPAPVAAGVAAVLTTADDNKQADGKARLNAELARSTAGSGASELTSDTGTRTASATRNATNQPQILTFADLRDKLRIGQPDASPSLLATQANPLQATTTLPLSAAAVMAQPKFDGTLDLAQSSLWLDQLANDIATTVDKKGDLRFRLMPAQLGEMTVQMRIGDNGMALRMETRSEDASRILSAHQSHLSDELRRQGIHVASTDISHTGNSSGQRGQEQRTRNPDYPFWTVETGVANDEQDTHTPTPARRGRFA